ncbi:MAG: endonuclease/exonuclease/phosphatase family protein [Candidatus Nanopelagicales bacterium]
MWQRMMVAVSVLGLGMLTACTGDDLPAADSATNTDAAPTSGIHLLAPAGWEDATLVTGASNGLATARTPMIKTGEGEFVAAKPKGETYFVIENGKGDVLDLGGTMGTYPGDPAENLVISSDDVWVDQYGLLHASDPRTPNDQQLTVLTVNLHTFQERGAGAKLLTVAKAVQELDADIVLLQEAAQSKDATVVENHYGVDVKSDNAALTIVEALKAQNLNYNYFWDWSHYGWDVWEEGSAILTKDKIVSTAAKYVTKSKEQTYWKSRKIPVATIETPQGGIVNAYSVHLGWWDDDEEPFKYQFDKLLKWADSKAVAGSSSLFGGDFNNPAGTVGYKYLMKQGKFTDVYLKANPSGMTHPTIGGNIDGWENGDPVGKRIDFLLLGPDAHLQPVISQRTFTELSLGRVSDHNGTYATFTAAGS